MLNNTAMSHTLKFSVDDMLRKYDVQRAIKESRCCYEKEPRGMSAIPVR